MDTKDKLQILAVLTRLQEASQLYDVCKWAVHTNDVEAIARAVCGHEAEHIAIRIREIAALPGFLALDLYNMKLAIVSLKYKHPIMEIELPANIAEWAIAAVMASKGTSAKEEVDAMLSRVSTLH